MYFFTVLESRPFTFMSLLTTHSLLDGPFPPVGVLVGPIPCCHFLYLVGLFDAFT